MSNYYTDIVTDNRLKILEERIHTAYSEASAEMLQKAQDFFDKFHDERFDKEYQAYLDGKYTKKEFTDWFRTQVERADGYYKMAEKLAEKATQADVIASALVNDATPSIFSLNANYEAYRINQAYKDVDLQMIDAQTAKELFRGSNHINFRRTRVNILQVDKGLDYDWNNKQIHKALTSAILQGKGIDELAKSFLTVMKRDENSARRNARTAFTSAQNAGRLHSYERAEEMGIEIKKEWIATLDDSTRDSHQELDGERVDYDEPFSNGLMYPADPSGDPSEVYNCRCTMRAILPKVNDDRNQDERAYKDPDGHRQYDDDDNPIYASNLTYKGYGGSGSYKKELQ